MRKNRALVLVLSALAALACSAERSAAIAPQIPLAANAEPPLPRGEPVDPVTRHPGDFLVHVVSGSFRKQPAVFTERVLAQEGELWVTQYTLEDSDGTRSLKAWTDPNGEVTRVSLLADGDERPGTLADYEAFMTSASLAPDENDGLTASTRGTCMVGPSELDCETKSYRIMLGEQEASLGITGSKAIPGLDLAGEITASDGTVIYRSILVEHGNSANGRDDGSVALSK